MAINKNHEFEDLNGVKCAIVEKNVSQQRADFLHDLLTFNKYGVVIAASPPSKGAPAAKATTEAAPTSTTATPTAPAAFTVGVTDVSFNPINAIFGRVLRTKEGHVVTLAYWQQQESVANDQVPYFENRV